MKIDIPWIPQKKYKQIFGKNRKKIPFFKGIPPNCPLPFGHFSKKTRGGVVSRGVKRAA